MNYLEKYGLTTSQIEYICTELDSDEINEFIVYKDRVSELLDYFISIGLNDITNLLIAKRNVFYEDKETVQKLIENCSNPNIINLLKEDLINFELIGL